MIGLPRLPTAVILIAALHAPLPAWSQSDGRVDRMKRVLSEEKRSWELSAHRKFRAVLNARKDDVERLSPESFLVLFEGWRNYLKFLAPASDDGASITIESWKIEWMIQQFGREFPDAPRARRQAGEVLDRLAEVSDQVLGEMPPPYRKAELKALRARSRHAFENPLFPLGKVVLSAERMSFLVSMIDDWKARMESRLSEARTPEERRQITAEAYPYFLEAFESVWLAAENPELAKVLAVRIQEARDTKGAARAGPSEDEGKEDVDPRRALKMKALEERARPSIRRLERELRLVEEAFRLLGSH